MDKTKTSSVKLGEKGASWDHRCGDPAIPLSTPFGNGGKEAGESSGLLGGTCSFWKSLNVRGGPP